MGSFRGGGYLGCSAYAGRLALRVTYAPSFAYSDIGGRCAR
jgi:hypothetical protein